MNARRRKHRDALGEHGWLDFVAAVVPSSWPGNREPLVRSAYRLYRHPRPGIASAVG